MPQRSKVELQTWPLRPDADYITLRLLKAGNVYINQYAPADPAAPFGGYKASGIGREMGHANLDAYLELKTVWTSLT